MLTYSSRFIFYLEMFTYSYHRPVRGNRLHLIRQGVDKSPNDDYNDDDNDEDDDEDDNVNDDDDNDDDLNRC